MSYALWRGGRPERLGALAMTLAYIVSPYAQRFTSLSDPQYGVLAIDAALFIGLLILALTFDRRWLLFAAAAQGLGVMTHLAIMADATLWPRAYLTANIATGYLVLAALVFGTMRCAQGGGQASRSLFARGRAMTGRTKVRRA